MSQSVAGTGGSDAGPGPAVPEDRKLTDDDIFDALSNRRRRQTLYYLQQNGDAAELGAVATQVAAWESGQPRDEVDSEARKRVYTSLQQFHLPKLDEAGIVTFDGTAGTVRLSEAAAEMDIGLAESDESTLPWGHYYLGLAALGSGLVALSWLGVAPLALVPNSAWVGLFLAVLLLSALVQIGYDSGLQLVSEDGLLGIER